MNTAQQTEKIEETLKAVGLDSAALEYMLAALGTVNYITELVDLSIDKNPLQETSLNDLHSIFKQTVGGKVDRAVNDLGAEILDHYAEEVSKQGVVL